MRGRDAPGVLVLAALAGCGAPRVMPVGPARADAALAPIATHTEDAAPTADAFFVPPAGDAAPAVAPCAGSATMTPASCAGIGVTVDPFYASRYTCYDLGPVPGLPPNKYGGVTLTLERCSGTLLVGGDANLATGKLYAVPVARDGGGHIAAFVRPAAVRIDAPYNDGGITYGPGDVLFFTRWPRNELQQTRPGSALADKVIPLEPLGVAYASASLAFVPPGLPGAGTLKLVSWSGGQWYTVAVKPDAQGTFDVTSVHDDLTLGGGPEGFVYVAPGSPFFEAPSMLVSEWSANKIAAYQVDAGGNPRPETRRDFVTGLQGAEGAYRDPATGDFFFSTWGQSADRVIVVRGFAPIVE